MLKKSAAILGMGFALLGFGLLAYHVSGDQGAFIGACSVAALTFFVGFHQLKDRRFNARVILVSGIAAPLGAAFWYFILPEPVRLVVPAVLIFTGVVLLLCAATMQLFRFSD